MIIVIIMIFIIFTIVLTLLCTVVEELYNLKEFHTVDDCDIYDYKSK